MGGAVFRNGSDGTYPSAGRSLECEYSVVIRLRQMRSARKRRMKDGSGAGRGCDKSEQEGRLAVEGRKELRLCCKSLVLAKT
ncbi:hypothetical protein VTH82DRAFT_8494 [Thermothelomyces myriococcoides]